MKKAFRFGFAAGGALGLSVALGMDFLMGRSFGGGWGEAVANDLNRIFKTAYTTGHPAVIAGTVAVIAFVGVIGGLMGGLFTTVVARFFEVLQKKHIVNKDSELK